MNEWFALIVLVPLILVPIVLLFGFAGCQVVFPAEGDPVDPVPPEVLFEKAFGATLNDETTRELRTIVQRIEPVRLSESGNEVRITLQRPTSGNLMLQNITISHAADPADVANYDSAATPTVVPMTYPLLVPMDASGGGFELTTVQFDFDQTKPILVAFDVGNPGAVRRVDPVSPTEATAFIGLPPGPNDEPVHEADIAVRQPGYTAEARIYLVQLIEVRQV
jgi:hypothetical protein